MMATVAPGPEHNVAQAVLSDYGVAITTASATAAAEVSISLLDFSDTEITTNIHRQLQLFEVQSYHLLHGWGRHSSSCFARHYHYCLEDGSKGWASMEDASRAILCNGWAYDDTDSWTLVGDWEYSSSYASFRIQSYSEKRAWTGLRRRKLTRKVIFNPYHSANSGISSSSNNDNSDIVFTCKYCDSKEISAVSQLLLEKYAETSFIFYPNNYNEWKAIKLKKRLLSLIGVTSIGQGQPVATPKLTRNFVDSGYNLVLLTDIVEKKFAGKKNLFRTCFTAPPMQSLPQRIRSIDSSIFTLDERIEIAKYLMRRYDYNNLFHCKKCIQNLGEPCVG